MGSPSTSFTSLYEPGPAWLAGLDLEEQPGWSENLDYWRAHARSARLRLVIPIAGREGTVWAVWHVAGIEEAELLAAETPLVRSAILKVTITVKGGPVP